MRKILCFGKEKVKSYLEFTEESIFRTFSQGNFNCIYEVVLFCFVFIISVCVLSVFYVMLNMNFWTVSRI